MIQMKTRHLLLLIIVTMVASSCAKKICVNYRSEPSSTSQIVIKPSKIAHKADITLNDSLIVESKKVRSLIIKNLAPGEYKIKITSGSTWYTERLYASFVIKVEGESETVVKAVKVPPHCTWYWVGVTSMVVWPLVIFAGLSL